MLAHYITATINHSTPAYTLTHSLRLMTLISLIMMVHVSFYFDAFMNEEGSNGGKWDGMSESKGGEVR